MTPAWAASSEAAMEGARDEGTAGTNSSLSGHHHGPDEGSVATLVNEDLVTAALGLLIVTAVYLDGRAHILGLPDSFFTPWHAFLYGGLLLLVG